MSNGKEKLEWRTDRKEFQFRCQIRKQHYFWCQIRNFLKIIIWLIVPIWHVRSLVEGEIQVSIAESSILYRIKKMALLSINFCRDRQPVDLSRGWLQSKIQIHNLSLSSLQCVNSSMLYSISPCLVSWIPEFGTMQKEDSPSHQICGTCIEY